MKQMTYDRIEALGRERLSRNFFMREFLYSEIAHQYQLHNFPHYPEVALRTGGRLCTELLEPLQATFGRVHVRSGYRSPEVNDFGHKKKLNCASNESNHAAHIWDYPDATGGHGAIACVVVPVLADYIAQGGSWEEMAWWIHDRLPYSTLCFFSRLGAFNIGWHERPARRIDSYAEPKGCLTRPGMPNFDGHHEEKYAGLLAFVRSAHVASAARGANVRPGAAPADAIRAAPLRPTSSDESRTIAGTSAKGNVNYRAIHTRTAWRRAGNHKSVESAIRGPNGAAALFAGKVRTRYEVHGTPLYVLVWVDGESSGHVIRPAKNAPDGIAVASIPVADIERFEGRRQASESELAAYFPAVALP